MKKQTLTFDQLKKRPEIGETITTIQCEAKPLPDYMKRPEIGVNIDDVPSKISSEIGDQIKNTID